MVTYPKIQSTSINRHLSGLRPSSQKFKTPAMEDDFFSGSNFRVEFGKGFGSWWQLESFQRHIFAMCMVGWDRVMDEDDKEMILL